jgi:hypothetical protein
VAGQAQALTPQAALERLFQVESTDADWYAQAFLAQVPPAQIDALLRDMHGRFGAFVSSTAEGDGYIVHLERADVPARIALDPQGRILGLFFQAPIPTAGIDAQIATIAALPGKTAVLVTTGDEVVAEHDADTPLAVGSAAKLAVLKAVADAVAAGTLAWDQVLTLDDGARSLPTGMLQDWPTGTPLTVATAANLAISISDNTAIDALLGLVGRDAVEAVAPRNTPFLTTREFFALKANAAGDLRGRWIAADAAGREALLPEVDALPLPPISELAAGVTSDVEWFFSPRELCTLLDETADLPAMQINAGLAQKSDWQSVAFKGGSEPGVLSLSTRVVGTDGVAHCVVVIWNTDSPLQEEQLYEPYRGLLRALATP